MANATFSLRRMPLNNPELRVGTSPRPSGLDPEYAAQFQDQAIVDAYKYRKPYPSQLSSKLAELAGGRSARILDLGCGTGDLTVGLCDFAAHVDAVDMSSGMLAQARARLGKTKNVRIIEAPAEDAPFEGPYNLVTAAQSLHWMDWDVLFPKLKKVIKPQGYLAIVGRDYAKKNWWDAHFQALIDRYSTNRDYRKYDLIQEIRARGYFEHVGELRTDPIQFFQPVGELIEAFHSRNGFSRDRMGADSANAFDSEARKHLERFSRDGVLDLGVIGSVTWSRVPDFLVAEVAFVENKVSIFGCQGPPFLRKIICDLNSQSRELNFHKRTMDCSFFLSITSKFESMSQGSLYPLTSHRP